MTTATPDAPRGLLSAVVLQRTAVARQSLKTALARCQRLVGRLELDLRETDAAETLRLHGELLKTSLGAVPRGANQVTLEVPWLGNSEPVVVRVRPELSAQANVQRLFARAKGLERGRAIIARRQEETLTQLLALEALRDAGLALLRRAELHDQALLRRAELHDLALLRRAELHDQALLRRAGDSSQVLPERAGAILRDVEHWLQAVAEQRLRVQRAPVQPTAQRKLERKRPLPKGVAWFRTAGGRDLLAGKNAAANDALVTRVLRGRDLWLHVRDQTGAHVVLRAEGTAPHAEADVREAAMLCAHLSGIAAGDAVEVMAAPGTGVRKVKGSSAGQVYVSGERAVRVRVEPAAIAALYQRLPPPAAS